MGTNAVVVVQEPLEFHFAMRRGVKSGFLVPEFHDRLDDPLGLAVGLGVTDPGEALLDMMLGTELHERVMLRVPLVLLAVVGVVLLDRIRAFLQDLLQEGLGRDLGLVRQDGRVELPGEVVDGNEEVFPAIRGLLALEQRQALGIAMEHLSRVVLVVAPGLALYLRLEFRFDLGEPLDAVPQAAESLVDALVYRKVPLPTAPEDLVNRGTRDVVRLGQLADLLLVLVIGRVNRLSLIWGQARALVYNHRGLLLRSLPRLITPKL